MPSQAKKNKAVKFLRRLVTDESLSGAQKIAHLESAIREGMTLSDWPAQEYLVVSACKQNVSYEVLRFLLNNGANVNEGGGLPLISLCQQPDTSIESVRLLLEYGADPNVEIEGFTPLMHVCRYGGDFDKIKLLLEYGADKSINNSSKSDLTTLIWAFIGKLAPLESIQLLLDYGASTAKTDKTSPLAMAILFRAPVEYIRLLLESGADVNESSRSVNFTFSEFINQNPRYGIIDCTPIMIACIYKALPEVIQVLLQAGANVNQRSCAQCEESVDNCRRLCKSRSAILYACEYADDVKVFELLIQYGADVNDHCFEPSSEYSALALLCIYDQPPELVKCFIKNGADVNQKLHFERQAIDFLFGYSNDGIDYEVKTKFIHTIKIAKLFLKAGVSISQPHLKYALEAQAPKEIILFFLEEGLTIDARQFYEICNSYALNPSDYL